MPASTKRAVDWLLDEEEPSIRYRTLVELLGKGPADPEVRRAQSAIGTRGWAAEILERQRPDGRWTESEGLYTPKYLSTNWMLLLLSDLGVTRNDPRIQRACDLWIREFGRPDGGFGPGAGQKSHLCTTGNTAKGLIRFGYGDDPPVVRAMEWLVTNQAKLGGWSCWGSGRNLDSWEPLAAFAALPRARWTEAMRRAVDRAAEFFLSRELHRQGDHYEPWYRFHYPVQYYYDLLVGLDLLTELGYGQDPRLQHALEVLVRKRGRDGRWRLDAAHPDVEGAHKAWFDAHPAQRPIPFVLEEVGQPSKMLTLTALKVQARVDGTI